MIAEIITVGDEIITGHIQNTNAAWLAKYLLTIGVATRYQTSVGDSVKVMEEVFHNALRRADLVIVTGGLGPTEDDLTKRAIVKVFRRNLIFHDEILEDLRARYQARGVEMPQINQNQALLPQGATFLPNKFGSAVGIVLDEGEAIFVALPGVPVEMKQIASDELPSLLEGKTTTSVTLTRSVRTSGFGESALAESIDSEIPLPGGVKLAYLPHIWGVDLRLMVTADSQRQAEQLIEQPEGWLKRKLGTAVFGADGDTVESVVGSLLREKKAKLVLAESCSAGMIAARLADVPGASDYLERGYITYSDQSKMQELNVSSATLKEHGAVSAEVAVEMARGALEKSGADFALSATGISGPGGGSDDKPVGLLYLGLAEKIDGRIESISRKYLFGKDRQQNRQRTVGAALNLLRLKLLGQEPPV